MRWIAALLVLGLVSCKNHKNGHTDNNSDTEKQSNSRDIAHAVVYKTKGDYYNLVPVTLSSDKAKIAAYPHPSDLLTEEGYQTPLKLNDGYLLDRRGVGRNTAFIKLSYDEYAALEEVPTLQELYSHIVDKDPFIEIYDCGVKGSMEDSVEELNGLIEKGELKAACEELN